ncbi:MAG: HAD family hydrolase [Acidobacteria bacterium]|nr:HAD family hydrolase [Acidobacteriota bacterium]
MRWTLFIDADDTLWENFAFFEKARDRFLGWMEKAGFVRNEVDSVLKRIDSERTHEIGFGSMGYREAMRRTMMFFYGKTGRRMSAADTALLDEVQKSVHLHSVALYPGVAETLAYLREKYPLFLVTKGVEDEQLGKVERAGVARFFRDVFVLPDKTPALYRGLAGDLKVSAGESWMIGNSPRSDINPPAEIGMGTVLIKKERAWDFEEVPLKHNGRFYQITDFRQLKEIF